MEVEYYLFLEGIDVSKSLKGKLLSEVVDWEIKLLSQDILSDIIFKLVYVLEHLFVLWPIGHANNSLIV